MDGTVARMLSIIRFAWRRYREAEAPFAAAAIAYYGFLSLVPFLLLVIAGIGIASTYLTKLDVIDIETILSLLFERYGRDLATLAQGVLSRSAGYGLVGLIGLFLGSSVVVTPIDWALTKIFGGEGMRSFLFQRVVSIGLFLVVVTGGYIIVGVGTLLQAVLAYARKFPVVQALPFFNTALIVSSALSVVLTLLFAAGCYLLMAFLPRVHPRHGALVWGAVFSGIAIEIARQGFLLYVRIFPVYDIIYGTIGFLIALVALSYLVSALFLGGAALAAAIDADGERNDRS